MGQPSDHRIEPPGPILDATRHWLQPVRAALGQEFVAAYLTGSVLQHGFDPQHSAVNLLVVARALPASVLNAVARALPAQKSPPRVEPLFLTRHQIESSLDVFPIEWVEIQERHLRLEGDDVFGALEVPRTYLRLQCEQELRGKHIRLRQAYLLHHGDAAEMGRALRASASGFATLFRTLLRLCGETPPADPARVIERLAELFKLDTQALLSAHLFRYSTRRYPAGEVLAIHQRFLSEVGKLVESLQDLRL